MGNATWYVLHSSISDNTTVKVVCVPHATYLWFIRNNKIFVETFSLCPNISPKPSLQADIGVVSLCVAAVLAIEPGFQNPKVQRTQ